MVRISEDIDDVLGEECMRILLARNSDMFRGDDMPGPVCLVDNAGNVRNDSSDVDVIPLTAYSIKVPLPLNSDSLNVIFNISEFAEKRTFIHYYSCAKRPHVSAGDDVVVVDPNTFEPRKRAVDEVKARELNFAIFRFGLS